MTLEELFTKKDYATDKLSKHSYIPSYEKLFQGRKENVKHVLEIGIGSGGSLELWADYFPDAQVYGIDLNYNWPHLDVHPRIHQIKDDAYSEQFIQKFTSKNIKFDVVIDDGPHNRFSQMMAMKLYFPLLKENGLIIVEDVQDYLEPGSWIKDIIQSLPQNYQKYARIIDLRDIKDIDDDLMIVVDKKRISDNN